MVRYMAFGVLLKKKKKKQTNKQPQIWDQCRILDKKNISILKGYPLKHQP